ncbi:MAG TPA: AAA family ATPase [Spirochaetota bacterium]|nr:AAA family ATPase [Spirochaetota bacterium]HOM38515.1 AAA family ATPase [Spirochaetota bacterium]HPQ49055.1 AAA family ATPase [Spirochaetota bacterium]
MTIKRISINNLRILNNIFLVPDKINFIIGNNGQGKTSILEAISLISGRSFKRSPDKELVRFNSNNYLIQINLEKNNISDIIKIGYDINIKKKIISINDKKVKVTDLVQYFPVVTFSHQDISFMYESRARKVFFDKMLSYIDRVYYNNLIKMTKAIKNRNRLIRNRRDSTYWDTIISEIFPEIVKKRIKIIDSFNNFLLEYKRFFPEGIENIKFSYSIGIDTVNKNNILKLLEERRRTDIERGFSTGIVFDHYSILVNSKKIKYFASTGQAKFIIFLLFFLQAVFILEVSGIKPILLLDDLFSDVDSVNRNKMLNIISNNYFQTFITMTFEDFNGIKNYNTKANIIKVYRGNLIEN